MATFFGGETLVNQTLVSFTGSTSSTVYTVPAGRYAIVMVQQALCGSAGTGSIRVGETAIFQTQEWYNTGRPSNVVLQSGQTISRSHSGGNGGSGTMFIREFNNP